MSGYIGPSPVPQGIERRQTFTATAGQTTFTTIGYTDGNYIDVYLNGIKLVGGTDYTATNGTDIVLTSAANLDDVLEFVTLNSLSLANHTFDTYLTLQNPTASDNNNARFSIFKFEGKQSGGEISTLTQIEGRHDGSSDDKKGKLIFKTNNGITESNAFTVNSSQQLVVSQSSSYVPPSTKSGLNVQSRTNGYAVNLSNPNNDQHWQFNANNDGDLEIFNGEATFPTIRIDNNDHVSIGDTSTLYPLTVRDNADGTALLQLISTSDSSSSGPDILLFRQSQTAADNDDLGSIKFYGLDAGSANQVFATIGGKMLDATSWTIDGAITAKVAIDGTLTEKVRIDGDGIKFNGDTAAANGLDDYEEGTWTPNLFGSTGGSATLTDASGAYTKIGRMVTVTAEVDVNSMNTATGSVRIGGLPFSVANLLSPTGIEAVGVVSFWSSFSTGVNSLGVGAVDNSTYMELYGLTSSTAIGVSNISVSAMGSGEVRVTCTYFTT